MYRPYHSSEWNYWHLFQCWFALILGVVILFSTPIVEQYFRTQEQEMLTQALEYFSQNHDFMEATLPENIEGVEVQRFKHLSYEYYDIKLATRNYCYDGEIVHGRLHTSITEAKETHVAELTKWLIIAGIMLIVLNLVWRFISYNYLFCTLYAVFEDLCWAIKRFFRESAY